MVYRHWPRTDELLAEAMATGAMPFFDAPVSPVWAWLVSKFTAIAGQLEHDDVLADSTTLADAALWATDMDTRRATFAPHSPPVSRPPSRRPNALVSSRRTSLPPKLRPC